MRSFAAAAGLALLSAPFVAAQTYTSCNPTSNCMPTWDFTKGENESWTAAIGTNLGWDSELGAVFTIDSKTDAPTYHTDFYIFFGYVEVKMRAANGTGIISSIVIESEDLDEIDWEWLGGNNTSVETNYFGKGNTTTYDRAIYYDLETPCDTMHTYGINWTAEALTWYIDGEAVRTLEYSDALNGSNYPQTPSRVSLGSWAGGASSNYWTVQWAGGETDFDDAPFNMYVESVKVINYNPGMNYNYTDETGSWQSIDVLNHTVAKNTSTSTATASSGIGASETGASASGSAFAQSGTSAAAMGVDSSWIISGAVGIVGFALGFACL
ncbi:glycoside hydrolase family 16 protein [Saccharata proteae CBS 121410]|uniref:chitinase n=1 Tax=Saccharata proteae CBS 121410 TaxID=1314787 RepID=A0A9P4I270_9PEZI|nr:glycoside hydrolase family 16 protein [Saccharata proteae CBS 121410]